MVDHAGSRLPSSNWAIVILASPERSASSSCVNLAATRNSRRRTPNVSVLLMLIKYTVEYAELQWFPEKSKKTLDGLYSYEYTTLSQLNAPRTLKETNDA